MAFFRRIFARNRGQGDDKPETPKKPDLGSSQSGGFVPSATGGSLIGMSLATANTTEGVPTLFVGIVDDNYTESMWNDCVMKLRSLFNIKDGTFVEIKIPSQKHNPRLIDGDALNESVLKALVPLNKGNVKFVRIARLGGGSSLAVFEALEGLLKGWQQEPQHKNVQFITAGESKCRHNFDFCKWLCLKRLCNRLEFFCTMDYSTMGFADYDQSHQYNN